MQAFLLMHNNYHTTVLGLHITVIYACCMSCQFQQLNKWCPKLANTQAGLCWIPEQLLAALIRY